MIRLFVAGYPRDATKEDLLKLFRAFGTSEDDITFPRDRRSRRKKGFAYVNVTDEAKAAEAISAFHLFDIAGKQLTVVRAADRPLKKPRKG